ncbi:MAG: aminotransferase class I/II-fold pyridoxal phosphate-dependent enzyme, partial [Mucilaginibacter sp.]
MSPAEIFIKNKLDERKYSGTYRALRPENGLVDFCSNDYLGFARSTVLKRLIEQEIDANNKALNGSTGSRLL